MKPKIMLGLLCLFSGCGASVEPSIAPRGPQACPMITSMPIVSVSDVTNQPHTTAIVTILHNGVTTTLNSGVYEPTWNETIFLGFDFNDEGIYMITVSETAYQTQTHILNRVENVGTCEGFSQTGDTNFVLCAI